MTVPPDQIINIISTSPNLFMRSWRHNRDVKINIMTQNLIYFIWENFCFYWKCHFLIAPGPTHKIQLRDFDLTQPCDTVTSWRHGMT